MLCGRIRTIRVVAPQRVISSLTFTMASTTEPRRSGRIAAKPVQPSAEVKPKAPRAVKKKAAEESTEPEVSTSKSKKVRPVNLASREYFDVSVFFLCSGKSGLRC
jgi:hypothetical protein